MDFSSVLRFFNDNDRRKFEPILPKGTGHNVAHIPHELLTKGEKKGHRNTERLQDFFNKASRIPASVTDPVFRTLMEGCVHYICDGSHETGIKHPHHFCEEYVKRIKDYTSHPQKRTVDMAAPAAPPASSAPATTPAPATPPASAAPAAPTPKAPEVRPTTVPMAQAPSAEEIHLRELIAKEHELARRAIAEANGSTAENEQKVRSCPPRGSCIDPLRTEGRPPERIRYEEEQKRLSEIDEELQHLTEKAKVLQEAKTMFSKNPANIPSLIEDLNRRYPDIHLTLSPQTLEVAIEKVTSDQNHLYQERAVIMGPLAGLPEDALKRITDLAPPEVKATFSQVSHLWNTRTVASLQHEYDRFIQYKIGQYIKALTPDETKPPFHSSPETLAAVRADLAHIMDDHCRMDVQTLKNLRQKIFELRNRARIALSCLNPADFTRIPSTPAPIGSCLYNDPLSNFRPDLPFDAFHYIQDLLLCYNPDAEIDETIRSSILRILVKQGDVATAREVVRHIATNDDLMCSSCIQLARAGDIEGSLSFVDTIHQKDQKDEALRSILRCIVFDKGDTDRARTLVNLISNEAYKNEILVSIVQVLAEKEDIEGALLLARSLLNPGSKNEALGKFCSALAKVGNIEQAIQVFREIKCGATVSNNAGAIVQAALKINDYDRALECARMIPNYDMRTLPFALIAAEIAKNGNIERALEVIDSFPPHLREEVLCYVISALIDQTKMEQALNILTSFDPMNQRDVIGNLRIALTYNGDGTSASDIPYHPAEEMPTLYGFYERAICSVADAITRTGNTNLALNLLKFFLKRYRPNSNLFLPLSLSLANIADRALKDQNLDLALHIVELITFLDIRDSLRYRIVATLVKAQDTKSARVIADMIKTAKYQKMALECIGYCEEKLALSRVQE